MTSWQMHLVWSIVTPVLLVQVGTSTAWAGSNPQYRLTKKGYSETDDLEAAVKAEFGPAASIADWEEIKRKYGDSVESIRRFCDQAGIKEKSGSVIVVRDGEHFWSDKKSHYLMKRHDGHLPDNGSFLSHDHIQNHFLDLGSGYGLTKPVLVKIATAHARYALTKERYTEKDDLEAAVKREFGPTATIADWEEIKRKYGGSVESIRRFCDEAGIKEKSGSVIVVRDSEHFWSKKWHYLMKRHDGHPPPPEEFLSHDHIQNHFLDLGSWDKLTKPILAKIE